MTPQYDIPFSTLLGETITLIDGLHPGSDRVTIYTRSGRHFELFHEPTCCESVEVCDVAGFLADLLGSPITLAEERSGRATAEEVSESGTWTFYTLATVKGYVDIRWLGTSNGYYSESVTFSEC